MWTSALVVVGVEMSGLLVVATFVTAGTARTVGTGTAVVATTHGAVTATVGARTTVATVSATVATGTTVAALATLVITLGLLLQGAHRQTELAGLLVNLDELDSDLVALMQAAGLHVLEAVPADLADVQQTVTASHELNEGTELEDADHLAGVDLSLFGNCGDGLDASHSSLDALLVGSSDLDDSLAVNLLDADGGTSLLLEALDNLATLADNCTDKKTSALESLASPTLFSKEGLESSVLV